MKAIKVKTESKKSIAKRIGTINAKEAIEVREYFYALEELIDKYKNYIIEGLKDKIEKLEKNQKPKVNPSKGVIYIIQTSDDMTLYKIGKTKKLSTIHFG